MDPEYRSTTRTNTMTIFNYFMMFAHVFLVYAKILFDKVTNCSIPNLEICPRILGHENVQFCIIFDRVPIDDGKPSPLAGNPSNIIPRRDSDVAPRLYRHLVRTVSKTDIAC